MGSYTRLQRLYLGSLLGSLSYAQSMPHGRLPEHKSHQKIGEKHAPDQEILRILQLAKQVKLHEVRKNHYAVDRRKNQDDATDKTQSVKQSPAK